MKLKKYSAFISSNYEHLKSERNCVIECLLDAQIIPICMEHFTITSSENFEDVKRLIAQSDMFIMILGDNYGSCDDKGISWTENEYIYAKSIGKMIYVLLNQEYIKLKNKYTNGLELNKKQKNQLRFGENIKYTQIITKDRPISRIINQIISNADFSNCIGWERNELYASSNKEKVVDLTGKWYHVHLQGRNKDYIRIGTVTITQDSNNKKNNIIKMNAYNYDVLRYEPEKNSITLDKLKRTIWSGEYYFKDESTIIGIYETKRESEGNYDDWRINEGTYRGIHDLNIIEYDDHEDSIMIQGTFHDIAPSPKMGLAYMFRSQSERYEFLKEYFDDVLRRKMK